MLSIIYNCITLIVQTRDRLFFHRGMHYYTSQEIGGIVIGVARRVNPIRDSGLKTL